MKKTRLFLSAIAVTAAALVSCEKEQDVNIKEEPQGVPFEIVAGAIESKTVNDGMSTNWVTGDKINLFHAVSGSDTYVDDNDFTATADGKSVPFSGTLTGGPLSSGSYDWFAVYPYSDGFDTPDGDATVNIPAAQTQVGNDSKAHLAGANCPVAGNKKNVAYDATPEVAIKHLTSIIKVHVTNKTASDITVSGVSFTAPVKINGAFSLDLTGDAPALSETISTSATTALSVTGGAALATDESADFYMAVKSFSVSAGQEISITVSTDEGDQTLMTVLPAAYTFTAGKIATLNFNFTNKPLTIARFSYNDGDWLDDQGITKPGSGAATALTGSTQTVGKISLSSTDGSTVTRVYNSSGSYSLRVYASGGSFTLSSDDDYVITKVSVVGSGFGSKAANVNVSCGSKSDNSTGSSLTWTGFSQEIVFSAAANLTINEIIVFYQETTVSDHIVSLPVVAKGVAYNTASTTFNIRTLNVSDLAFSCSSSGYSSHSYAANTLTVNLTENTSTSPRDIVVNVTSASAGFAGTLTITQDGGPSKINTLTGSSTGVTVVGQVTALTTKGFVLSDDTASIYVYLNASPSAYSIGQSVAVAGDVSANSKGLQFNVSNSDATATPGATGSYVYPSPTAYGLAEVTAFNADGSDRLATYVQFDAVVDHSSLYYNFYVGGTSAINATLYNAPTSFTSGLATGDYVTVKGYAAVISGGKMGVYVTEVTESDTAPALIFSDITAVPAAGVTNQTHTVTPYRIPGSAPSVTYTGCVSAASINAACNTVTYSVSQNNDATTKSGTIVITFTVSAQTYVYTINVTQDAKVSGTSVTLNIGDYATANSWASGTAYGSITIDSNITMSINLSGNNGKYYSSNDSWRAYEGNSAAITLTASNDKTLQSVTFTYAAGNNGAIVYSATTYASGATISLSGTTATFGVTHTSGTKTGNVQITSVNVVYN